MKAVLFDAPGPPEVLHLGDAPMPDPGPDEVLVRVRATAVNRADLLQRRGAYPPPEGASPILGLEIAGETVQSDDFSLPGERVMAVVSGGGYAEYAVVPKAMAIPIPDTLSYVEAAAIPEAFLTAHLNLFTLGKLRSGESVLIHAGGSGVGTAAIQLAKAVGARVITTAGSADKLARCLTLGADVAINYRTESFRERVLAETGGAGVNLILDFIGAPYWNDNLACLGMDGRLQLIGFMGGAAGELNLSAIMGKRLTVTGTTLRRTPLAEKVALTRDFSAFALLMLAAGTLRPVIDRVYELHEATLAHHHMESNANFGKIILEIGQS